MRWPPNQAWTSAKRLKGYRHFEVKQYGGKGQERWVELFPVLEKQTRLRISWSELKTKSKWTSGWLQLPEGEDCSSQIEVATDITQDSPNNGNEQANIS